MPVISGNDPFPAKAWKPVKGLTGVYRADLFTGHLGTVSAAGGTLIERSLPTELQEGEFCLNHASQEFLTLRLNDGLSPREGERQDGRIWRHLPTDADGYLDLGQAYSEAAAHAVFWASTYVWVEPRHKATVWNPDYPEVISGRLIVGGAFRASRISGIPLKSQLNKYRLWVNGQLLPAVVYSTEQHLQLWWPHPSRNTGPTNSWENFPLQEGWNHLVCQFDTTSRPEQVRFKFGLPQSVKSTVTSAVAPARRDRPMEAAARPYISEYLVLGPFPARPDLGVYVHLPHHANPNSVTMDLAALGSALVAVRGDFVQVRGFEVRHGVQ